MTHTPQRIERIAGARIAGRSGLATIELLDGRIARIVDDGISDLPPAVTLAAEGCVVLPAFVDAHVHLDKAFLQTEAEARGPLESTLEAAIASIAALRPTLSLARVRAVAEQAIARLVRHGVTAARVQVEIDPTVGLDLVRLHKDLAETSAPSIALQLVAFPQRGLEMPGMVELFAAALESGLDVVGGCPYVDADPRRHLDLVFAAAERHGLPVDLHLDLSDDPGRSLLRLVAECTHAHGMAGRVTIGHVTTLAAMPVDAQSAALELLAESGISLVVLPATDLFLTGHGEPGTRSLAPWERAHEFGVRVAIANNNLCNPFAPFGNGNILQAAWLAGIARRTAKPEGRALLLEAVTRFPAGILGLPAHGLAPGDAAHLVVVDSETVDDVMLQAPAVLATLRSGRLTSRVAGPQIS